MKLIVTALLLAIAFVALPSDAQSTHGICSIKFSIAERDSLGNVNVGFSPDGQKWFEKKIAKKYPSVCYAKQEPNYGIWFFISVSTQTEEVVPRIANYPVYTLKIAHIHDGKTDVLRTFQRAKSGTTAGGVSGIIATLKNPERDVISDAIDWLSKADPTEISESLPN
jgi:hypothetical protein